MNRFKFAWVPVCLLLGSLLAGAASADRGDWRRHRDARFNIGIGIGPAWFSPWYYGPSPYYYPGPLYYPPPVATAPVGPTVYIERAPEPAAATQGAGYWYYCRDPQGYYPYVKQCPGGWQPVAAEPPAPGGGN
jgi:hypothetical protein